MSEWIKVSDRLPEDEQHVVFTDGMNIFYGFGNQYEATFYWTVAMTLVKGSEGLKTVTHWFPVEFPKGV